ncbi:MAG: hypothetical protein RL708_2065, partial [Bacteroidota bacterium]
MLQHDYFFKIHATFNQYILFIYQRILVIKNEKKKAINPSRIRKGFLFLYISV